ncbi:hypothetical protein PoB_000850400 [Plakobranchus ocellatus]|uniref:Uncharacterized protein n=1 Tax=Plakobranchus ocellatus TaxID=259542 RepID=A0AAV3YIY5_9GAST|nr:hypothetical protein PoB_000850400 [Plakobranchus ocellatus]
MSQATVADNTTTTTTPVATPESGSGLQCYHCSSFLKEHSCDNPNTKDTPIVNCSSGETMCRKIEQHIHYEGSDHIRTYRECAKSGDLGKCLERTGTYKFKSCSDWNIEK